MGSCGDMFILVFGRLVVFFFIFGLWKSIFFVFVIFSFFVLGVLESVVISFA